MKENSGKPGTQQISQCIENEIFEVMAFIDRHWAKGHILSQHISLMRWQHQDPESKEKLNWFIARDRGEILGVLGFIPTHLFDSTLRDRQYTIWLALWKVRAEVKSPGLGLRLLGAISRLDSKASIGVLGINPELLATYRALGYAVGELTHFFVCNPDIQQHLIAAPSDAVIPIPKPGKAIFQKVDESFLRNVTFKSTPECFPIKTPRYFENRYFSHPIYEYLVFAISLRNEVQGVIAARIAEHNGSRALRFIDFMGDETVLADCGSAIQELLRTYECEYADFWQFGIDEILLKRAGFQNTAEAETIVVPNYFEPFVAKTSKINFAFKGHPQQSLRLFRGDGDQDRPNKIPAD